MSLQAAGEFGVTDRATTRAHACLFRQVLMPGPPGIGGDKSVFLKTTATETDVLLHPQCLSRSTLGPLESLLFVGQKVA